MTNTDFSSIEEWFTDQNSNQLEIKDNVNMTLIIGYVIKMRYSTEPKYRKYIKGYGFLSFARWFGDKYGKKFMDTATKTEIDAARTASKRVVQKAVQAIRDLNS